MNTVMIIDGGGRGTVLIDKYAQSPHVKKLLAVPGNPLMQVNTHKPVKIYSHLKTTSVNEILEICNKEKVDLVDVAQDNAVEAGLVDLLNKEGINVIGPTKQVGQIEWDKAWAREFMAKYDILHPTFKIFHNQKDGINYLKTQPDQRWFVKAFGLVEGKGALAAENNQQAVENIYQMERFGDAGKTYLLEQWLKGEEFSTFIISDGKDYKIIGSAQDHKRINNFDTGENTGGMGCSSPPLVLTKKLIKEINKSIIYKTIECLNKEDRPYKGILYLGGILVKKNKHLIPYVIEFNARLGDPEAQVIVPSIQNDLFELSMAVVQGNLKKIKLKTDNKSRVVVSGASKGYPRNYQEVKGKQIFGLKEAQKIKGVKVYGAGVKEENGKYFASGGRLFHIVGEGKNVIEARKKAYQAISLISVEGNNLHYRTDIGWRDVERIRS